MALNVKWFTNVYIIHALSPNQSLYLPILVHMPIDKPRDGSFLFNYTCVRTACMYTDGCGSICICGACSHMLARTWGAEVMKVVFFDLFPPCL